MLGKLHFTLHIYSFSFCMNYVHTWQCKYTYESLDVSRRTQIWNKTKGIRRKWNTGFPIGQIYNTKNHRAQIDFVAISKIKVFYFIRSVCMFHFNRTSNKIMHSRRIFACAALLLSVVSETNQLSISFVFSFHLYVVYCKNNDMSVLGRAIKIYIPQHSYH